MIFRTGLSLQNSTAETFGAKGLGAWGNYRGRVGTKIKSSFFKGTKYSDKVFKQMNNKKDIVHSFPKSVDGYANKCGQRAINIGKDGKTYQWLKLNGSYQGKTGTFEYIKDSKGVINHRYFKISK